MRASSEILWTTVAVTIKEIEYHQNSNAEDIVTLYDYLNRASAELADYVSCGCLVLYTSAKQRIVSVALIPPLMGRTSRNSPASRQRRTKNRRLFVVLLELSGISRNTPALLTNTAEHPQEGTWSLIDANYGTRFVCCRASQRSLRHNDVHSSSLFL